MTHGSSYLPRLQLPPSRDGDGRRYDAHLRRTLEDVPGNTDPLAGELVLTLLGTARRVVEVLEEAMARRGVSMSRFAVLIRLWRAGRPLPLHEVAGLCNVSARNITGLVDGLEEAGLVSRVPEPRDRRITLVELTPAGAEMLSGTIGAHSDVQRRIVEAMSEGRRRELIDLCLELAEGIPDGCGIGEAGLETVADLAAVDAAEEAVGSA